MKILFIRHAEPDYAHDSLTPKGRREAELLARRLVTYPLGDLFVSPLGRARETAEYTTRLLHREAEILPWLPEFRGRYPDPETGALRLAWDLKPRVWSIIPGIGDIRTWLDDPFFDGGNIREIWMETVEGTDRLMARYGYVKDGPVWKCAKNTDATIALFCHFGISMAVIGYLTDQSPMVLWHRTLCLPSSVSEIITEERIPGEVSFRITKLGDLAHLESAGEPRSLSGLFPEIHTGVDSTDPAVNRTPPWPFPG